MNARLVIIAIFGAVLASCTPASFKSGVQVYPPLKFYNFTQIDIAAIEFGVRRGLKDPFSAIFGEAKAIIDARNVISVCGTVNAKNSFGGYNGFVPYYGVLATNDKGERAFLVASIGDAPSSTGSLATLIICRDSGIPF